MATRFQHHRHEAESLLAKAERVSPASPARLALLMEASVHATLAQIAQAAGQDVVQPGPGQEALPVASAEEVAVAEMAKAERAKARAPRAPRKPKTTKPAEDTWDGVPGSEEDLIRQEAAK
ncbi:hypothetical protein SEA_VROOMVROOM_53 [Arthrobacter phage VroomVroom]|uniref:Uncharacterized protein n=1 Tax=Arthrobacter phage VroomVroom TaxID=3049371 RepID=A0AA49IUK8_9CAUD|nr:hypothetical protein SEA_VROOMVROOM_53 [Arthrobacter phage VroomVroom]